MADVLV